jgi:hypothetical protein
MKMCALYWSVVILVTAHAVVLMMRKVYDIWIGKWMPDTFQSELWWAKKIQQTSTFNQIADLPRHSGLLLENCCMWRQPTCEKSSSRCQQEVLLFFPSDLKSSMVTPISDCLRHFLLFFPRTGSFEVTSLAINVSLGFWRSILYTFFNDSEHFLLTPGGTFLASRLSSHAAVLEKKSRMSWQIRGHDSHLEFLTF